MTERPTDIGDFGEELYAALGPAHTDETGSDPDWELLSFCGALGSMLERAWDVVQSDEHETPWAAVFNADDAEVWALPYLAQFAGVRRQLAWTDEQLRAAIKDRPGLRRGTPASIIAATKRTLTGSKTVIMTERDTGAYNLSIRTLVGETPDEDIVLSDILTQKPAGIVLDYQAIAAQDYNEVDTDFASYNDLDAAYDSYDELAADL